MLLRVEGGGTACLFGLTGSPMFSIVDWHGRPTGIPLDFGADLQESCLKLAWVLHRFDSKKAARAPYRPPLWARALAKEGGTEAMAAYLEKIHPRKGTGPRRKVLLQPLIKVYRSLEPDPELFFFSQNYLAACRQRAPEPGQEYPGHEAEAEFLQEMSRCRNDRVKFDALTTIGLFSPLAHAPFFVERAAQNWEGARNGNVVLCSCLDGLRKMAARGARDQAEQKLLLETLALPVRVLQTEERNNGACRGAAGAIEAILEATGAPEALAAYFQCLRPARAEEAWIVTMTDRFRAEAAKWLAQRTGQELGVEHGAWEEWFGKHRDALVWKPGEKRFEVGERGGG